MRGQARRKQRESVTVTRHHWKAGIDGELLMRESSICVWKEMNGETNDTNQSRKNSIAYLRE